MSTHNIGFYEDLTKIIFQLSSNKRLISYVNMPFTQSMGYLDIEICSTYKNKNSTDVDITPALGKITTA